MLCVLRTFTPFPFPAFKVHSLFLAALICAHKWYLGRTAGNHKWQKPCNVCLLVLFIFVFVFNLLVTSNGVLLSNPSPVPAAMISLRVLWLAGLMWFILLKIMLFSPGYFPGGNRTSLFFMGEWAALCTHTAFSLCARPLMGTLADSRIWLCWSATINTET